MLSVKKSVCLLSVSEQHYNISERLYGISLSSQCLDFCLTLGYFFLTEFWCISMARCNAVRSSFAHGEDKMSGEGFFSGCLKIFWQNLNWRLESYRTMDGWGLVSWNVFYITIVEISWHRLKDFFLLVCFCGVRSFFTAFPLLAFQDTHPVSLQTPLFFSQ